MIKKLGLLLGLFFAAVSISTPTLQGVFYVDSFPTTCTVGSSSYSTQADCAWYSTLNYQSTTGLAAGHGAVIVFGTGFYPKYTQWVEPPAQYGITLIGQGYRNTMLSQQKSINAPMLIQSNSQPASSFDITGINFDGGAGLGTTSCMDLPWIISVHLTNLDCNNLSSGSDHNYQLGWNWSDGSGAKGDAQEVYLTDVVASSTTSISGIRCYCSDSVLDHVYTNTQQIGLDAEWDNVKIVNSHFTQNGIGVIAARTVVMSNNEFDTIGYTAGPGGISASIESLSQVPTQSITGTNNVYSQAGSYTYYFPNSPTPTADIYGTTAICYGDEVATELSSIHEIRTSTGTWPSNDVACTTFNVNYTPVYLASTGAPQTGGGTSAIGPAGPAGAVGPKGATGATGPAGPAGSLTGTGTLNLTISPN